MYFVFLKLLFTVIKWNDKENAIFNYVLPCTLKNVFFILSANYNFRVRNFVFLGAFSDKRVWDR